MAKNTMKIFAITLMASLMFTFSSFASEGMSPVAFSDTMQIFKYIKADDTVMKNQWKQVWDNWYYFDQDGKSKQNTSFCWNQRFRYEFIGFDSARKRLPSTRL